MFFTCLFLLKSTFFVFCQNFQSVNPGGNWNNGATWNGGVAPGNNNTANVTVAANTTVTINNNLAVGNNGTLTVHGVLIDPAGGTAYAYDAGNTAAVDVYNNMTIEGAFTATQTVVVHVHGCATLNTGPMTFSNNTVFIVDACATVNITGDFNLNNSNASTVNGTINVSGNVNGNQNSSVVGTGTITAQGSITTNQSSSIFGNSTTNCANNPLPCVATGGNISPLPIELLTFEAIENGNDVELNWSTASEQNNNFFTLERSYDGFEFSPIGIIPSGAPNGNSSVQLNYSFTDKNADYGIIYYRLKQTDYDHTFSYSNLISVHNSDARDFEIFPNPNDGIFQVKNNLSNYLNFHGQLNIFSPVGELVYSVYVNESTTQMDLRQFLSAGTYHANLKIGEHSFFRKIIITK